MDERIRVVIAGPGPDDRSRGAESIARSLRDAGMEVVYTDRQQTPEQLVETAVQEDADAVGLSVPSGADPAPLVRLAELLAQRGIDDVLVFGADGSPSDVVDWLRAQLRG